VRRVRSELIGDNSFRQGPRCSRFVRTLKRRRRTSTNATVATGPEVGGLMALAKALPCLASAADMNHLASWALPCQGSLQVAVALGLSNTLPGCPHGVSSSNGKLRRSDGPFTLHEGRSRIRAKECAATICNTSPKSPVGNHGCCHGTDFIPTSTDRRTGDKGRLVRWEYRDQEQLCERPTVARIAEGDRGEKGRYEGVNTLLCTQARCRPTVAVRRGAVKR
jgi:hypothetical protein